MLFTDCKLKSYEERLFNIFYSAIAAINTDPELYRLLRTAFCTVKFVNRNRTRYIACEMPENTPYTFTILCRDDNIQHRIVNAEEQLSDRCTAKMYSTDEYIVVEITCKKLSEINL